LESVYNNYAERAGEDGKHRCLLCTKLFKAVDFVKKHIRNKHPELVVDTIAKVGESYMWEQYREDPNRPLPPIETTNHISGAVLGRGNMSRGPSYRSNGNQGGHFRGGSFRGRGGHNGPRRGSFGGSGDSYRSRPPAPRRNEDMPVDPRQISTSYQDLDNLKDKKVELDFDALGSLPPPKKKSKA